MKVIIVDDEPGAIKLIASYLSHYSDFELVNTFRNGLKALEFLNTHEVDVVFLDINMPHLNGLSLAKMISPHTSIVFTTAYSEHAVESYSVEAIDYLLKPISLERFSKTATKLINQSVNLKQGVYDQEKIRETIFVKSGSEIHQVIINDIEYLKKDGNYMHYFTGDKKIMVRQNIAEAMSLLTSDFIQVQKSYLVNFTKIDSIKSNFVVINGSQIPIGVQFKDGLFNKMKF